MIDSSRSQRGGIATWQGLDYQKRFIAYLSISMLSEKNQIIRITCEDLDDIKRRKDDMHMDLTGFTFKLVSIVS